MQRKDNSVFNSQTCIRILCVVPVRPVVGPGVLSFVIRPLSSGCVHITRCPGTQTVFKAASLQHTLYLYVISR